MRRAVRFDNQDIEKEIREIESSEKASKLYQYMKDYNNYSITENGALGYQTAGHELLDLHFQVSSLRSCDEKYIIREFVKAYYSDPMYAVKWLFFLRDILEGLGERRSFRIGMKYLAISKPEIARTVMKLIPEYGRYDDLLMFLDTPLKSKVSTMIRKQLKKDMEHMKKGEPISLLAKWLPSNNTSSKETRRLAEILRKEWDMTPKEYRQMLSALRKYLGVLEVTISKNEWENVDYKTVPAKANLKYENAFMKHDKERRIAYFENVILGEENLNTKGLMPYEIVHRITSKKEIDYFECVLKDDILAELMWKKLTKEGFQNEWGLDGCIVVADGSGSMMKRVSNATSVTALDVCQSLAIYFAEQLQGVFHNKVITFSGRPQWIDLESGTSLKEKLEIMYAHSEVANTNIEAVFNLLLDLACNENVPSELLPKQVLIMSDMEFDEARRPDCWAEGTWTPFDERLFETIAKKYEKAGYSMPRLIFWNLCGRTNTIPMVEGENGICLLSGFSQNAIKVAGNKQQKDPYQNLLDVLDGERYQPIEDAIKDLMKTDDSSTIENI